MAVMVLVAAVGAAVAPAASAAGRFVPGEALVRFERGSSSAERASARDRPTWGSRTCSGCRGRSW